QLLHLEEELFKKADIVFTGGHSLYEAKKNRHQNIRPFPAALTKTTLKWHALKTSIPTTRDIFLTLVSVFMASLMNGLTSTCCGKFPNGVRTGSLSSSGQS